MTKKLDESRPKKLTEGTVKKGGVGQRPTAPRPAISPAGQKPRTP